MISKAKLKELCAYRQQKRQDEEGVFIVEGAKMAAEALQWGAEVLCVCATSEWRVENGEWRTDSFPLGYYEVSPAEMERLSLFKDPSPVWMLVKRGERLKVKGENDATQAASAHLSPFTFHLSPLTLALDCIQDPGNMGTMMRTVDWYGVRHIVCSRDTVSCYNPKVVRASMGAIFRTRVEYVDLPKWLADCNMLVFGASLQGQPLSTLHTPLSTPKVLLIGNEGRGISPEAMAHVTHPVLIPNIGGTAESLNAAVAAAILMDRLVNSD